jgi:hypothetical protein
MSEPTRSMIAGKQEPVSLAVEPATTKVLEKRLPSGRSVVIVGGALGEHLEVRSPDGAVEVTIDLRADGPVVRLSSARMELESLEKVSVNCREFEVKASEAVRLESAAGVEILAGEHARVRAAGDLRCDGERILLNCQKL